RLAVDFQKVCQHRSGHVVKLADAVASVLYLCVQGDLVRDDLRIDTTDALSEGGLFEQNRWSTDRSRQLIEAGLDDVGVIRPRRALPLGRGDHVNGLEVASGRLRIAAPVDAAEALHERVQWCRVRDHRVEREIKADLDDL